MLSRLVNQAQPLEPTARVLVLGRGYSGRCFSQLLNALGTPVISTRRKPDNNSTDIAFDSATDLNPAQATSRASAMCCAPFLPHRMDGILPLNALDLC